MDKYCETELISKMDINFETEGVIITIKRNFFDFLCIDYKVFNAIKTI